MFKNLIISLMGSWMICNMNFWIFDDALDKFLTFFVTTIILFIVIDWVEDQIKSYRRSRYMRRWRMNRFNDVVEETTYTSDTDRVQECEEIINALNNGRSSR